MNNHVGFSNCQMTKESKVCLSYFWFITFVILMPYFYKQDLCVRSSYLVILCEIILHMVRVYYTLLTSGITESKIFRMPWMWAQIMQIFWLTYIYYIIYMYIGSVHFFCLMNSMIEQIERTRKNFASLMAGDGLKLDKSQNQNAFKYNSVLELSLPSCQDTCSCTYIYKSGDSRYPSCLSDPPSYCVNMSDFCIVT